MSQIKFKTGLLKYQKKITKQLFKFGNLVFIIKLKNKRFEKVFLSQLQMSSHEADWEWDVISFLRFLKCL